MLKQPLVIDLTGLTNANDMTFNDYVEFRSAVDGEPTASGSLRAMAKWCREFTRYKTEETRAAGMRFAESLERHALSMES